MLNILANMLMILELTLLAISLTPHLSERERCGPGREHGLPGQLWHWKVYSKTRHPPPLKCHLRLVSRISSSRFFVMFFGSAGIGTLVALLSSLVLKYIDLYTNPRYWVIHPTRAVYKEHPQ